MLLKGGQRIIPEVIYKNFALQASPAMWKKNK